MRFEFIVKDLKKIIKNCSLVIESKNIVPICAYIKFYNHEGKQYFTATNLENTVIYDAGITDKEFSHLIDPKDLLKVLDVVSTPNVSIEFQNDFKYTVFSGLDFWELISADAVDYPKLETHKIKDTFEIDVKTYISSLNECEAFTGNDIHRPVMNSVYHLIDSSMSLVATDAHKLIYTKDIAVFKSSEGEISYILPRNAIKLLNALPINDTKNIIISISDNHIKYQYNNDIVVARKIEGTYPNAIGLVQSTVNSVDKECIVDPFELLKSIKKVSICTNSTGGIKCKFLQDKLILSAQDVDLGKIAISNCSHDYKGEDFYIGFNYEKFTDCVNIAKDKQSISMNLLEQSKACIMYYLTEGVRDNKIVLLMPLIIDDYDDGANKPVVKEEPKEVKEEKKEKKTIKKKEPVLCPNCENEWSEREIKAQSCETCGYPNTDAGDDE